MNVPYYLEMYSRKFPNKTFLKTENNSYTYREMNRAADRLAYQLEQLGIKQNDKVIMQLPNSFEFIVTYFAVLKTGAIIVPINTKLTLNEVKFIEQHAEAKAFVVEGGREEEFATIQCDVKLTSGHTTDSWISLYDLLNSEATKQYESTFSETDLSTMLYTSGTTGRPKAVVFTNRNVIAVAKMICIEMKMDENSNSLLMMPLSHSAPLHLFFLSALVVGAQIVTRKEFHPLTLLQTVEAERTTHFFGAPVAYLLAAKILEQQSFDLSSMEWWVYGGAPMGANEVKYVEKMFNTDGLTCVYGLTEAGPSGSLLFAKEHKTKAGSVGRRASLFTEIKIVNELGEEVAPNEVGEIVIRGLGVMKEYYRNEEETKRAFINGWLRTGDLGTRDEEGYIWIVDRVKDVIISGGVNIYPSEVEQELLQYTGIKDVAVVGIPHKEWGETVKAFYVSDEIIDEEEVKEFLSARLASHKIPKIYEKIDSIPRNATGKILKHVIKDGVEQR